MTNFKLIGAALILSVALAAPSSAQVNLPGDYSFFYPKDDFGPAVQAIQPSRAVNVGGLRVPGRSHHYIHHIRAH
jgi:hypothetical protein